MMALLIVLIIIIIFLSVFSFRTYIYLRWHMEKTRSENIWSKEQFGKIVQSINSMIRLLWPESAKEMDSECSKTIH